MHHFYLQALLLLRKEVETNIHFHSIMALPPATKDAISGDHSNRASINVSQNKRGDKRTATENVRRMLLFNSLAKTKNKPQRGWGGGKPNQPSLYVRN